MFQFSLSFILSSGGGEAHCVNKHSLDQTKIQSDNISQISVGRYHFETLPCYGS